MTARVRCSARSKQTGDPCKLLAIPGGTVCRFHGGAAPAVKAAAARRVEQARVTAGIGQVLDELEEELADRDPLEALLDAVVRARAMATVLGSMLDAGAAGFPAQLELYERWLGLQARTAKLALDAGVDERQVRIAEAQAQELAKRMLAAGRMFVDMAASLGVEAAVLDQMRERLPHLLAAAMRGVHPSDLPGVLEVGGEEVR